MKKHTHYYLNGHVKPPQHTYIVDSVASAEKAVATLRALPRNATFHACDTEVSDVDLSRESVIGNGFITCFSLFSGPHVDYGRGKKRLWVKKIFDKNIN